MTTPTPLKRIEAEGFILKRRQAVLYASKSHTGSGLVVDLYQGGRGAWVTVHDKERGVKVTVRPTQVFLP